MDDRFFALFEAELDHIRSTSREFASLYKDKSKTLFLDSDSVDVADPYVERLLEGFAFIAARIQSKFDEQFPKVSQALLENVFPQFLAPVPSMTIVDLRPRDLADDTLVEGPTVPRHTEMLSHLPTGETNRCVFRTAQDVRIWPLRIAEARLHADGLPSAYPAVEGARAALSIELESTVGEPLSAFQDLSQLTFFLRDLKDRDLGAFRLHELLFGSVCDVAVRALPDADAGTGSGFERLGARALERVGFRDDEAVLPISRRGFQGYRLLREYFFFERRFLFFRLGGLKRVARALESKRVELVFFLREPPGGAERFKNIEVNPDRFSLFASPAANVFERSAQMTPSDRSSDFVVIPNKKDPLDYEVFDVQSVEAEGKNRSERRLFSSFYAAKDPEAGPQESARRQAYFAMHREPRPMLEYELASDLPPAYRGTQVRLSLVDVEGGPFDPATRRLVARTLCTNRDLVLRKTWPRAEHVAFPTVESPGAVSVRGHCLVPPTPPRPSAASGETAWRLVNHLSLNYLTLLGEGPQGESGGSPAALQDLLRLYAGHSSESDPDPAREDRLNQIRGLRGIKTAPVHERFREGFVRGLGIEIEFDEKNFLDGSAFLLGSVLDAFFAKYVSINSFTRTSVRSTSRGKLVTWNPRVGQRHLM